MTTTKWILCVIAASATSSYATLYFFQPNQNELSAASSIENFSDLKSSTTHATGEHQEFAKENDHSSDNCEKKLNNIAQPFVDTSVNNPNEGQQASIEDVQLAYEKKQNEVASFREFIQRTGDSVLNVITKNYDSEPIDPEWARSKEDELLALLETSETLQNSAPLELSCKSQNCRLVLAVQDTDQGEFLYDAFKNDALKGSDENKKQAISYFSNPNDREIHIYLSKNTVNTLLDVKMD